MTSLSKEHSLYISDLSERGSSNVSNGKIRKNKISSRMNMYNNDKSMNKNDNYQNIYKTTSKEVVTGINNCAVINYPNDNPHSKPAARGILQEAEEVRTFPELIMAVPTSFEEISKRERLKNSVRIKREMILKNEQLKHSQLSTSVRSCPLPFLDSNYSSTYVDMKKGGNKIKIILCNLCVIILHDIMLHDIIILHVT